VPYANQPLRLEKRQWLEQNPVDEAEDQRIRPDGGAKRHDGRERENGGFEEAAKSVSHLPRDDGGGLDVRVR
jgi:hypothetical protein